MERKQSWLALVAALALAVVMASPVTALASMQVEGVLGLTPVLEQTCFAVQLPLQAGQAVTALRWFNNDAQAVFPRVLVVEGAVGMPPGLDAPLADLASVAGVSSGWSTVELAEPVAGSGGALYAVFVLPAYHERTGTGVDTGPGIGYGAGVAGQAYLSPDGEEWVPVRSGLALAVEAVVVGGMGLQSKRGSAPAVVPEPQVRAYVTQLLPATPNPLNPSTSIAFELQAAGTVELSVYNVRGERVATLVRGELGAGPHVVDWQGSDVTGSPVASGVYLVRLDAAGRTLTQRVTVVR